MKSIFPVLIISATVLIVAFLFSTPLKNSIARNDTISVIGLGEQEFDADIAHWTLSFSRKASTLQAWSIPLKADKEKLYAYLLEHGIHEKEITVSPISSQKEFQNTIDAKGQSVSNFDGYTLTQSITVVGENLETIDKIESVSKSVTELIEQGIEMYSSEPEYLYTKLADIKISLIAKAASDAHLRAEQIAKNSGINLGSLKNATTWVLQITAKNSSESYSDIGAYNTNARKKVATITIKTQYTIH